MFSFRLLAVLMFLPLFRTSFARMGFDTDVHSVSALSPLPLLCPMLVHGTLLFMVSDSCRNVHMLTFTL